MASLKSKYPLIIGAEQLALRTKCPVVDVITPTIRKLGKVMAELVHEYDGVGIAAPQLDHNIRMMIATQRKIAHGEYKLKSTTIMINPEITSHSDATARDEEGCLSLPGIFGQVERYKQITVQYLKPDGKSESKQLSGLDAVVVQHEIDHLDGILFIDKAVDIRYE